MNTWDTLNFTLGSGFLQQYQSDLPKIDKEATNYAMSRKKELGYYSPSLASDYYKMRKKQVLQNYSDAAKRRSRKKMDLTDEVIQAVAVGGQKTTKVSGANTLNMNFLGAPLLDEPSLVSRTILG